MDSVTAKREKCQAVPAEMFSKEFLSQFKIEEDVSQFLKDLHSQVLEQMLQGEMDAHLGYDKHSTNYYNSGNSRNGSFSTRLKLEPEYSLHKIVDGAFCYDGCFIYIISRYIIYIFFSFKLLLLT